MRFKNYPRILIAGGVAVAGIGVAQADMDPLVEPEWLAERLEDENLVVLDIRNAIDGGSRETYEEGHIPGAVYSDYMEDGWRVERDGVVDRLPEPEALEELIGGLGIDNDTRVVVVPAGTGSTDFGSATRVHWTFRVLGHDDVAVLNGGYAAWEEAGLPLDSGSGPAIETADFEADFQEHMVASLEDVEQARAAGIPLVDTRPEEHHAGREQHPDANYPGTIPGSVLIEDGQLVPDSGRLAEREQLERIAAEAGLDGDQEVITFCNTAHWASISWFALSEIGGHENVRIYDGSMVEWAATDEREIETERTGLAGLIDRFLND